MSIKYDNTELQGATYTPRYVKHESAPDRIVNSLKLARQDGEVIIDDTMGVKYIDIVGILIGTSQSDLETKIDAFKELIARKDKNLDVDWAGGTRRYVCRSINHSFDRDHYNILYVPYTIRFLVPTGYGQDTTETTALNKSAITATTDSETITFDGSVTPKLRHKIIVDVRGNADVIKIENTATGDYIEVDLDGFVTTNYLEIDEVAQTVKKNGTTNLSYRGKFPSVTPGSNTLLMTIYGSGSVLDQYQLGGEDGPNIMGDIVTEPNQAQSFIQTQSGRVHKLVATLKKLTSGALGGYLNFRIFNDNNGKPGTLVHATNSYQIAISAISAADYGNLDLLFTGTDTQRPFLVKGQRYWIVAETSEVTGTDVSNLIKWRFNALATSYANGKAMYQKTSSDPWVDGYAESETSDGGIPGQMDMDFAVYRGSSGGGVTFSLTWQIYYTKKYL
jgi:hypothetical protein